MIITSEQAVEAVLNHLNELADHIGKVKQQLGHRPLSMAAHDYVASEIQAAADRCLSAGDAVAFLAACLESEMGCIEVRDNKL